MEDPSGDSLCVEVLIAGNETEYGPCCKGREPGNEADYNYGCPKFLI